MDIIINDHKLRQILQIDADPDKLQTIVSQSGPTVDRIRQTPAGICYEVEAITNRIDTASTYGFAKEANAIFNHRQLPSKLLVDPYQDRLDPVNPSLPKLDINILDESSLVRLTAILVSNVTVKPSTQETVQYLESLGERGVNNLVDISNEVTNLFGLPNHIFDYDKLIDHKLSFRIAGAGETLTLLDGTQVVTAVGDIVAEDGSGKLVDLCGVMGGLSSEVIDITKNILVLVPVYAPKAIRSTSLRTNHRTLASQIYEKSPDPELCLGVLKQIIDRVLLDQDAEIASQIFDYYPRPFPVKEVKLNLAWLNRFTGIDIPTDASIAILNQLGFTTTSKSKDLVVTIPSSRYHDINIQEDLAEEILRVYGYHHIPGSLPPAPLPNTTESTIFALEDSVRLTLARLGYQELISNSLISADAVATSGLEIDTAALSLSNPLTTDQSIMRSSLLPSLLTSYFHNQTTTDLAFFEIASVYSHTQGKYLETPTLAIITNRPWRQLKGQLFDLLSSQGLDLSSSTQITTLPSYFQSTAAITLTSGDNPVGYFGLIKKSISRNFDITTEPIYVELDLTKLVPSLAHTFIPTSTTPDIIESLTLESDLPVGEIIARLSEHETVRDVIYTDSFQGKHNFTLYFNAPSLTKEQVEVIKTELVTYLSAKS